MNRKVTKNSLLFLLVVLLSLTVLDFKTSKPSFKEEIGYFIQEKLGPDEIYSPLALHEVNESFLYSLTEVQSSFTEIRDSIHQQLNIISGFSKGTSSAMLEAESKFEALSLKSINEYLIAIARLKKEVRNEKLLKLLRAEELNMNRGLNKLNDTLSLYNLSIYNLNFEAFESKIYFHLFNVNDPKHGTTNHKGIFELDKKTKAVLSYKEI